ncbi:MAG: secretin N-terminal domain-containing protein [Reichenbachiella sp.]|uniref:type II secretion system protein GspD n=1 Tax=Reichenbachiella sp. TaxID=2184521 RepID=UPI0032661FCF
MKYFIIPVLLVFQLNLHAQSYQQVDSLRGYINSFSDSIPSLKHGVDISVSNTSLKEFLRAIAETHKLNLSLDGIPQYTITNNFEGVNVAELLAFVCSTYNLDIKFLNNIIIIHSKAQDNSVIFKYDQVNDKLSFHLDSDTLKHFSKELTDHTHYNIVLSREARDIVVHGFIEELPFSEAMRQFAASNDLHVELGENNVYYLSTFDSEDIESTPKAKTATKPTSSYQRRGTQRRSSTSSGSRNQANADFVFSKSTKSAGLMSIDATGADLYESVKTISKEYGKSYFFLEMPKGQLECHLMDVSYEDFLSVALSSSSPAFSFSVNSGTYMIGDPKNLNIYESQVFTFKNRSVESVVESIPVSLLAELEVSEYSDLNSLIITGSEQRIDKLIGFLDQIDKPVANVLIEVMVVVINRGSSIETGISAGLSDSIPSTSGSILPGADLTLSSTSINKFLNDIDRRGVINLGRVTPQFYATIKALEQDNFLDLQSTPKLSTVNGHEANLIIGNSVYYLVETQNVTGGVNPIITTTPRYEKVEANLELNIKPFVSYNEDVTLDISFESSDFIDPTISGAPPGNSTRKFDSKIRIKNEEMIVVGGLEQESVSENSSGLPGIAKIPIIKWFFSKKSKSNSTNKLLVFIKPTIVY